MMFRHFSWLLLIPSLCLVLGCLQDDDDSAGDDEPNWVLGGIIDTEGPAVLATMDGPWGEPLYLIRVEGTDHEMGYQYGRLLGLQMVEMWWTFIGEIGEEFGASDPEDADYVVGNLLDQAWVHFDANLDPDHREMFEGMAEGMEAAGCEYGEGPEDLLVFVQRLSTMVEFAVSTHMSGDDMIGLAHMLDSGYADELLDFYGMKSAAAPVSAEADALVTAVDLLSNPTVEDDGKDTIFNCSTYAAWGDRTVDGALFGTRNMDFSAGMGIAKYANVATFVPDDGVPWTSVGWIGLTIGGLALINQQGVTLGNAEAATPMERLATESEMLKGMRAVRYATDLDSALSTWGESAFTMGTSGILSWGDPLGGGAGAEAAAFELNGLSAGIHRMRHDCSTESELYRFTYEGGIDFVWTNSDHPELANLEADAVEIDAEAQIRYFECTAPCASNEDLVLDPKGDPIETGDPKTGMPIQTGYPRACAIYRGDSAFSNGVRMHQKASHGPMNGDGTGLMIDGGAYRDRYTPQWEMTDAYEQGVAYSHDDQEYIADNGGQPMLIGLDEVEAISRVAGMDSSNVWNVVWDATNLVIRVSFENGTGDDWIAAKDSPSYLEIDLDDLFLTD